MCQGLIQVRMEKINDLIPLEFSQGKRKSKIDSSHSNYETAISGTVFYIHQICYNIINRGM